MLLQHDLQSALSFLTGFGNRPLMGPMDLGASNTVTEHKFTLAVDKSFKFGFAFSMPRIALCKAWPTFVVTTRTPSFQ